MICYYGINLIAHIHYFSIIFLYNCYHHDTCCAYFTFLYGFVFHSPTDGRARSLTEVDNNSNINNNSSAVSSNSNNRPQRAQRPTKVKEIDVNDDDSVFTLLSDREKDLFPVLGQNEQKVSRQMQKFSLSPRTLNICIVIVVICTC